MPWILVFSFNDPHANAENDAVMEPKSVKFLSILRR